MKLFLVLYDIPSHKKGNLGRVKLKKKLEDYGRRVQFSAFEVRIANKEELKEMFTRIVKIIDKKRDSVRIYPIHGQEEDHVVIFGEGELYKPTTLI